MFGRCSGEVCAHIKIAAVFQCSALDCSKADCEGKLTKRRRQIDASWIFFPVRERGRVRVLLLIVIVLFSSVSLQQAPSGRV